MVAIILFRGGGLGSWGLGGVMGCKPYFLALYLTAYAQFRYLCYSFVSSPLPTPSPLTPTNVTCNPHFPRYNFKTHAKVSWSSVYSKTSRCDSPLSVVPFQAYQKVESSRAQPIQCREFPPPAPPNPHSTLPIALEGIRVKGKMVKINKKTVSLYGIEEALDSLELIVLDI